MAEPFGNGQMLFEEVFIGGEPPPLRLEQTRVNIDDVRLDKDNPRLKYQQMLYPNMSLVDLLFNENDTRLLKDDINKNGLIDPPYLRRDEDGKFTAIEGNRRTACMTKLHAEFPHDTRFATMFARILPVDTPAAKQALLMAQFHISGKLKWDAHERAGHVYDMWAHLDVSMEQLKSTLHMGEPAIRQMVEAYRMLNDHYKTIDNGKYQAAADGKWSFFAEFFKQKVFREKVMATKDGATPDPFFRDRFCRWVGEGRLPRAEDVRKLPAILADANAKVEFEQRPAIEAFEAAVNIAEADPASKSKFFKAVRDLHKAGLAANMNDIMLAASDEKARKHLIDAKSVLDNISRQASILPQGR